VTDETILHCNLNETTGSDVGSDDFRNIRRRSPNTLLISGSIKFFRPRKGSYSEIIDEPK
jgi:hypothetical protein